MPVPVISIAQMREWENANWAAGRTEMEIIRRVGAVLARRALELTRPDGAILILAGKGHNGDDARAAQEFLTDRRVEVLEFPELGMEAVWRIEVEDFPAFIVIDDKGNDFYDGLE